MSAYWHADMETDRGTTHRMFYGVLVIGGPSIPPRYKRGDVGEAQIVIPVNQLEGLTDDEILFAVRELSKFANEAVQEYNETQKNRED